MLGNGGTFSSRNASSPGNSLGLESFSWTAYKTVLPVSDFLLGKHIQTGRSHKHLVEAQWNGDLDKYGSFCITVPLYQLIDILFHITKSNGEWDSRAGSDPQAPRGLDVR